MLGPTRLPTPLLDKMSERAFRPLQLEGARPRGPRKAVDKNATLTFVFVPKIHGGPGLLISFELGGSFNIRLNEDWRFKLTPSGDGGRLVHSLRRVFQAERADSRPAEHQAGFRGRQRGQPLYRFGKEDGSHVEFGQFEIEFEFSTAVAGVRAVSRKSELVLNLGKSGNGFLSQVLPGEKRIPLNLGLGWSTERGFFIDGGKGNVITQRIRRRQHCSPAAPRSSALPRAPQAREGDAE